MSAQTSTPTPTATARIDLSDPASCGLRSATLADAERLEMARRNALSRGDTETARACEAGKAALLATLAAALGYEAAAIWPAHSQLFRSEYDLGADPCNPAPQRRGRKLEDARTEADRAQASVWLIPTPPSLNNIFANGPSGRRKTRAYQAWRDGAMAAMVGQGQRRSYEPPYEVSLWFHVGSRSDVDNRIKPVLDLLQMAGIILDDRFVDRVAAQRDMTLPEGRCLVRLASIGLDRDGRPRHGR